MSRKLGRVKIDSGEFAQDADLEPIEVLLPVGAVVFTLIAEGSKIWLHFYYEGPNWRKGPLVAQRFVFWFPGECYSGPLGPHISSVVLNGTVGHLFRLE